MTDAVTLSQYPQVVSAGTDAPGVATCVQRRVDVGHVPAQTLN